MEKQTENRFMDTGRGEERRGEGEMYAKRNMDTYIAMSNIDSQWEFAVWLRKLEGSVST